MPQLQHLGWIAHARLHDTLDEAACQLSCPAPCPLFPGAFEASMPLRQSACSRCIVLTQKGATTWTASPLPGCMQLSRGAGSVGIGVL